ncbi:hypothetical protein K2X33_04350 [bacterium]|nr:hypothetical protein [bacterium]
MKRLVWLAPVFLCGCLLQQTDPAPVKTKGVLMGSLMVETKQFSNITAMGQVSAVFKLIEPQAPAPKAITAFSTVLQETRGVCTRKVSPNVDVKQEDPEYTDVGDVVFGPALQQAATPLIKGDNREYFTSISPAFPAGAFQFQTTGTDKVDRVAGAMLSMPEPVTGLRINGKDFGDPLLKLTVDHPVTYFWRMPGVENSKDQLLIRFVAKDADNVYEVSCRRPESDLASQAGFREWEIDSSWFQDFPENKRVETYFMRYHAMAVRDRVSDIESYGIRTYYMGLDWKQP